MFINFFDFNTAYISGIYLVFNELNPLEVTLITLFWSQTLSIFIYLSHNSLRYHSMDLSFNYLQTLYWKPVLCAQSLSRV